MSESINTHGMRIGFGKHEGELYTRVPVGYLKWMVNAASRECEIAQAELDRRGTTTPELDISGHAIDSASNRLLSEWKSGRGDKEGLHSWLVRISTDALEHGIEGEDGVRFFNGIKFVFEVDGCWPVLKTVMKAKKA